MTMMSVDIPEAVQSFLRSASASIVIGTEKLAAADGSEVPTTDRRLAQSWPTFRRAARSTWIGPSTPQVWPSRPGAA